MQNQIPPMSIYLSYLILILSVLSTITHVSSKATIEPCSNADSCNALVGYTLYTDLKVSEVAGLFGVDPISLLTANAIDISYPDVEHHILPSKLFMNIPIKCSCIEGIRKSVDTHYKTRPSDTLPSIADGVYGGLVSADQLREANSISDPAVLDVGTNLVVPLPCVCFNRTDNLLPAVYLSYVVLDGDTLPGIAARYRTTNTDLMNVNSMGTTAIAPGDILAVPLPACASGFPRSAADFGLTVPNGSYAITASHCVQCTCGPGGRDLYCIPASLAVSCSSMQCKGSNLMLGNVTAQQTSGGCNVTSCSYSGFANGTILTTLTSSLRPRCPGPQQFPLLAAPPTTVSREYMYAPAPAPSESGGSGLPASVPSSLGPGFVPGAGGPAGSIAGNATSAGSLLRPLLCTAAFFFTLVRFSLF